MELDLNFCTGNADTCPVVQKCFEYDAFAEVTKDIDPNAQANRAILGDFVTSCAIGTCPGQNIEATKQVLREFIKKRK